MCKILVTYWILVSIVDSVYCDIVFLFSRKIDNVKFSFSSFIRITSDIGMILGDNFIQEAIQDIFYIFFNKDQKPFSNRK